MEIKRMPNSELYHHGIKGQKWGRRRYQNPDGSLTPEGKKRYGIDTKEGREAAINSGDIKKIKAIKNELTSDELNRALNRIRLNDQLNSLDKASLSKGEQWIKTHKDTILAVTSVVGAATTAGVTVSKLVSKATGRQSELEEWTDKAKIAAAKKTVAQVADYFEERNKK